MGHLDRQKVASIAQMLLELSDDEAGFADGILKATQEPTPESIAKLVSAERRKRREREVLFGTSAEIFSDPAWDILLELFEAQLMCCKLSASSVGLDSGIAQSTALRWIALLEKLGLCSRRQDPVDRRRYWVRLTTKATTALELHFSK